MSEVSVSVSGRHLLTSIVEFERKCLALIEAEQRKLDCDTRIVDALCEGVRLSREFTDSHYLTHLRTVAAEVKESPLWKQGGIGVANPSQTGKAIS